MGRRGPIPRQECLRAWDLRCQGRSIREIAAELGCTAKAVDARLRRCRRLANAAIERHLAGQLADQVHQIDQLASEIRESILQVEPGRRAPLASVYLQALRDVREILYLGRQHASPPDPAAGDADEGDDVRERPGPETPW